MKLELKSKIEFNLDVQDKNVNEEDLNFLVKLLDPVEERQTGRTTLFALAYLKLAVKYPNREIYFQDHLVLPCNKKAIINIFEKLMQENKLQGFVYNSVKGTICYIPF